MEKRTAAASGGRAVVRCASRSRAAQRVPCSSTARSPGRPPSRHGSCPARSRCSSAPDSRPIMADTLLLVDDDASVLAVLERLRREGAAVILLTGQGDIETAVKAMQLGAENFLTKPVDMTLLAAAI